jgi:uncharacterized protein DUF5818
MRTPHYLALMGRCLRRSGRFLGLLGAVLILTACAQSGTGSSTTAPSTTTAPSGAAPSSGSSASAVPSPSSSSPASASASVATMVLTGQVEAGVEAGCLILRDTAGTYQLIGGDPAIVKVGARVRVTGHVAVGVMSYCMQGKPFQVVSAQPM